MCRVADAPRGTKKITERLVDCSSTNASVIQIKNKVLKAFDANFKGRKKLEAKEQTEYKQSGRAY